MSAPLKFRVLTFAGTRRGRWPALALWIMMAAAGSALAVNLYSIQDDSEINWLPVDSESTRATELAESEFDDDGTSGLVILYTAEGRIGQDEHAAVEADLSELGAIAAPGEDIVGPVPSEDGRALMLIVPLTETAIEEEGAALVERADAIAQDGLPPTLTTGYTGQAVTTLDTDEAFEQLGGPLTWMTVAVVTAVLILSYRSPLLLVLPLACIAISSQVASALAYLLGEYAGVTINSQNSSILTVLVFGASTNYTLLLVSRYREELRRTEDRFAAMTIALSRTLPAVAASAATVVLALAVLPLADVASTASLGPVLIAGVVSAVLTSMTLLPAVLSLFGRAVFWPVVPHHNPDEAHVPVLRRHRFWGAVAKLVSARPRSVALGTAAVLGALALGWITLSTGLEQSEFLTGESESQIAAEQMAEHYPAGTVEPTEIYAPAADAAAVTEILRSDVGVAEVGEPTESETSDWTRIDATLTDEASTAAAQRTVERLRASFDEAGSETVVGGSTAITLDLDAANDRDLRLLVPLILAVVFTVIMVLLRAAIAALVLTLCTVLSFASAVGAASLALGLLGRSSVDGSFFLFGFLFLVAMGVDYTIFLMTRAKEEVPTWGHRVGTLRALTLTGGVITSAGLVLAATFCVLALMPLTFLMQTGVVVAAGILMDSVIVRSLLVPALSLWIGKGMWWPGGTAAREKPSTPPRNPVDAPA